jgi:WD40 repeat protein
MRASERTMLAIANDGTVLAFTDDYKLMDLRSGNRLAALPSVRSAAFSSDATKLLAGGWEGEVTVYETQTGSQLTSTKIDLSARTAPGRSNWIDRVEFSQDGSRLIVTTTAGELNVFDDQGKLLRSIPNVQGGLAGLSRDGSRAAIAIEKLGPAGIPVADAGVIVWDLTRGVKLTTYLFKNPTVKRSRGAGPFPGEHVYGLSLDGLKVYRLQPGALSTLDLATKAESIVPANEEVQLGKDSKLTMLSAGTARIGVGLVIDLADGKRLEAEDHVARSEDGRRSLRRTGLVIHEGRVVDEGHRDAVDSLAFGARGTKLYSSDGYLRVWDTATCERLESTRMQTSEFQAARGDGSLIMVGKGLVLREPNGKKVRLMVDAEPRNVAASSDGRRIYASTLIEEETWLDVLHADGKVARSVPLRRGRPNGLTLSPGNERLALKLLGKNNRTELQIISTATLAVEATIESIGGTAMFIDDERLLLCDPVRGVSVRKLPSMEEAFALGVRGLCSHAAVSSDGRYFASARDEGRFYPDNVYLWELPKQGDVAEARFVAQLRGHSAAVTSLAFSVEGVLATGSADTTVLLWDPLLLTGFPESSHVPDAAGPVPPLSSGSSASSIYGEFACKLSPLGELSCRGSMLEPDVELSAKAPLQPVASDVKSFGIGIEHWCVLHNAGTVSCAGRGERLGRAEFADANDLTRVDSLTSVQRMSAKDDGTCVRASPKDGEEGVYCWGVFQHGNFLLPTLMRGLAGTTDVRIVSGRPCAVKGENLLCLPR